MAVVCPACKHEMTGKAETCENCGEPMPEPAGDTLILKGGEVGAPTKKRIWSSAQVGQSRAIRAYIDQEVHTIHLPSDKQITLGRSDLESTDDPDVDLAPYDAVKTGVSRRHAAMRLFEDMVQVKDLNSTNGTFLNGQQVGTSEWRIVRDGDKLTLGSLKLTLFFDTT